MATTTFSPDRAEQAYSVSGVIPINTNLFWIDLGRFPPDEMLSAHVISLGASGTLAPEFSNDDVNWRAGIMETIELVPAASPASQTATLFMIPVYGRFFRLRLSAATTAGTTTVKLSAVPKMQFRNASLPPGGNNIGQVAARAPEMLADVPSAAITTTTTTSALTPSAGRSYSVNIAVTAVSGTSPTLDVGVEESDDNGTNWFRVYDFPRISANGFYRSPIMPLRGTRVRYVQNVQGTTPSFTRAINRVQVQDDTDPLRQIFDRAVAVNTLNATTATLVAANCGNQVKVAIHLGSIGTGAPAFQLEGSDDNANWVAIGAPITGIVGVIAVNNIQQDWAFFRVRVSTAGVGASLGNNGVLIRAHN